MPPMTGRKNHLNGAFAAFDRPAPHVFSKTAA